MIIFQQEPFWTRQYTYPRSIFPSLSVSIKFMILSMTNFETGMPDSWQVKHSSNSCFKQSFNTRSIIISNSLPPIQTQSYNPGSDRSDLPLGTEREITLRNSQKYGAKAIVRFQLDKKEKRKESETVHEVFDIFRHLLSLITQVII